MKLVIVLNIKSLKKNDIQKSDTDVKDRKGFNNYKNMLKFTDY